ncbi:helix-turn-helix transcriptional regulator [Luteimonas aquatica]|uniref:helix-turn-helix transcriptional regulator n=1 Tax=Luteimonas aquatica TaxID=450364 RepID=UPI001F561C0C|nr:helix-turn-helix transcriptional regulator [Luteimonas aquatica]
MTREIDARLRSLFDQMPGLWGCKDEHSVFMYANARYTEAVGLKHHLDAIGRSDFDMPCDTVACAHLFQAQDKEVMLSMKPLRVIDIHPFAGGEWRAYLSTKTPMMDDDSGKVVGTIFHLADITSANTVELGSLLGRVQTGIQLANGLAGQGSYVLDSQHRGAIKLSQREAEVLFFLVRGKTIKEIGAILELSPRTVENYIDAMKGKFAVENKGALIDQAIFLGYLNYIPERLFKQQLSVVLR